MDNTRGRKSPECKFYLQYPEFILPMEHPLGDAEWAARISELNTKESSVVWR